MFLYCLKCIHNKENSILISSLAENIFEKGYTKITILNCKNKNCNFLLEFRSNKESEFKYKLVKYCNKHNHELKNTNGKLDFTPAMLENLKELRCVTDDTKAITKHITKNLIKNLKL